jgi:hypothetical protein
VAELSEDALLQMPPFPAWFSGWDAVAGFHVSLFARDGSFRAKGLAEAFGLPEELPAESRAEH